MRPKNYKELAESLSQKASGDTALINNRISASSKPGLMTYGDFLKNRIPEPSANDKLVEEINRGTGGVTGGAYQKFLQSRLNSQNLRDSTTPGEAPAQSAQTPAQEEQTPASDRMPYETVPVTGNDDASVPSYSEALQRKLNAATDRYNNTVDVAERNRDQTIENAETERQRSVRDADSSYQTEKSTYGANAEALRRMGLSGSGYAEYLDSKAYAQKRSDIQGANVLSETRKDAAGNTYADAVAAAKDKLITEQDTAHDKYREEMTAYEEKQETKRKEANSMYTTILGMVKSGSINEEEARQLASDNGLSAEQTENLASAAKKYQMSESDANRQEYKIAIDALGKDYDITEIDRALKNGSLTESDAEWLTNYYQTTYPKTNEEKITDSISDIQKQYAAGKIDEKKYNEEMQSYTSAKCEGGWCITGLGTGIPGDSIGVVIGAKKDDGSGTKFELDCGKPVTENSDKALFAKLNELATGSPNKSPSVTHESIFGNKYVDSEKKGGKLVVYQGKMYLFTTYGWSQLVSRRDKVDDAIATFLKASERSGTGTSEAKTSSALAPSGNTNRTKKDMLQ